MAPRAETDTPATYKTIGNIAGDIQALASPEALRATSAVEEVWIREYKAWGEFQRQQTERLLDVFYKINYRVLALVTGFWLGDHLFDYFHPGGHAAIVTSSVLMALVAATAAQLGALVFAVGPNIFRPPPNVPPK